MKYILIKLEDQICTLTINRPNQYNALNINILKELDTSLDWIINKSDARVVILTGSGDKSFIAGADIKYMKEMNKDQALEFSQYGQELTLKIEEFDIPIIAAVNGFAIGGGCEFAMACHIRYASENAIFAQPEVSLGLIAGWGGTQRLPRLVGKSIALEMLLTGNSISAEKAKCIGLINEIVPADKLIDVVQKLALSIIKNAPLAITSTIESVNLDNCELLERFKVEKEKFSSLFESEDANEGLTAFFEKRRAKFTGK